MKNEKKVYVAPEAEITELEQEDVVLYSVDDQTIRNLDKYASFSFSDW